MIVETIKELSKYGEVLPGSRKERQVTEKVREFLEEGSDEVTVIPTTVLAWEEKEVKVDCGVKAIALPYSKSGEGKIKVVRVRSLFDIPKAYMEAAREGAEIVAFTLNDRTLRRFVVKFGTLLQYSGAEPPVPALFMSEDPGTECYGYVKTDLREGTGYTIEATRNGKSDEFVVVSAHHDHFMSGEHDDLAGVALLRFIKSKERTIKLVSFTAEEMGCFYDTLSWGCGARSYVNGLKEYPYFMIDIDFPDESSVLFLSPGLENVANITKLKVELRPQAYTSSYAFLRKGIPTLTLSPLEERPYYHSNLDIVDLREEDYLNFFASEIEKIANRATIEESEKVNPIYREIRNVPLEARLTTLFLDLREVLKTYRMVMTSGRARYRVFGELIGMAESYDSRVTVEELGELGPFSENSIVYFYEYKKKLSSLVQKSSPIALNEVKT